MTKKKKVLLALSTTLLLLFGLYLFLSLMVYLTFSEGSRTFTAQSQQDNPQDNLSEEVSFLTRNGDYRVYASYFRGEPNMPALISVHGYNMSRHSEYHRARALGLHQLGYTVLSIDLSDNGGDTVDDRHISMGYREQWEVLAAFDYLCAQGFVPESIGIVAESMGASAALMALANEPSIKALWADSPFSDISALIEERLKRAGYPSILTYGTMLWGQIIAGDALWTVNPIDVGEKLADHHQAVYLIATREDEDVLFHHGADLYKAYQQAGVDVSFWDVPNLDHVETITYHHDEYMRRLDRFFRAHLAYN